MTVSYHSKTLCACPCGSNMNFGTSQEIFEKHPDAPRFCKFCLNIFWPWKRCVVQLRCRNGSNIVHPDGCSMCASCWLKRNSQYFKNINKDSYVKTQLKLVEQFRDPKHGKYTKWIKQRIKEYEEWNNVCVLCQNLCT